MAYPTELQGTEMKPIAAGAHWQLGKVESHGGWFSRVLDKLISSFSPDSRESWLQCVHHAHVKNQMLQVHGFSPHQFVFGKNPIVPEDLLSKPRSIVSATASLTEDAQARAQELRTAARTALIQMQDDRSLRVALLAWPRVNPELKPGDLVEYWRNQKWVQGTLQSGRRWWGTAVILGKVGRNYVLLHRRQVIHCAPEQIRAATSEEQSVLGTPHAELLGIKDMIESGNMRSKQYLDLLPQSYPPQEGPVGAPSDRDEEPNSVEAPERVSSSSAAPHASSAVPPDVSSLGDASAESTNADARMMATDGPSSSEHVEREEHVSSGSSSYGPMRIPRRVTGKDGPMAYWRPPAMKEEDFLEVMKEVVPNLVDQALQSGEARSSDKRSHDQVDADVSAEPSGHRAPWPPKHWPLSIVIQPFPKFSALKNVILC